MARFVDDHRGVYGVELTNGGVGSDEACVATARA